MKFYLIAWPIVYPLIGWEDIRMTLPLRMGERSLFEIGITRERFTEECWKVITKIIDDHPIL
jgi:hypothetical protein